MGTPVPVPSEAPPTARGIGSWRLLGIASAGLALAAIWALYNVFMPLLLAEFIDSRAVRGVVMGLDNVIAVVLIPVVGAWSDRVRSPWGQRLPFLFVGVPLTAATFALLPFASATLWGLLIVAALFLLAVTFYRAPLAAVMPDHVPPERRSWANGVITLVAAAGGAIALLLVAPWFDVVAWLPFVVVGAVALVTLFLVVASSDRQPPFVTVGSGDEDAPPLGRLVRDVRSLGAPQLRGALLVLVGLFLAFFGYSSAEAQFSSFATQTLGTSPGGAGIALGAASGAYVLAAMPAGWLARRYGELRVMRWGAGVLVVALAASGLLVSDGPMLNVCLAFLGAGWSLIMVPGYPLVANQGGRERIGFFTGMYYFFGAAAAIVGPAITGLGMDAFGDRALFVVSGVALAAAVAVFVVAGRRGMGRANDARVKDPRTRAKRT